MLQDESQTSFGIMKNEILCIVMMNILKYSIGMNTTHMSVISHDLDDLDEDFNHYTFYYHLLNSYAQNFN